MSQIRRPEPILETSNGVGSGPLLVSDATASTNPATGALTVAGGVGVLGDIYSGGTVHAGALNAGALWTSGGILSQTSVSASYFGNLSGTPYVGRFRPAGMIQPTVSAADQYGNAIPVGYYTSGNYATANVANGHEAMGNITSLDFGADVPPGVYMIQLILSQNSDIGIVSLRVSSNGAMSTLYASLDCYAPEYQMSQIPCLINHAGENLTLVMEVIGRHQSATNWGGPIVGICPANPAGWTSFDSAPVASGSVFRAVPNTQAAVGDTEIYRTDQYVFNRLIQ